MCMARVHRKCLAGVLGFGDEGLASGLRERFGSSGILASSRGVYTEYKKIE